MKYHPSAFYHNFSMVELVKANRSAFGILCANGLGGGIASGHGFCNPDEPFADYNAHSSCHCHLKPDDRRLFDQIDFIRELESQIKAQISSIGIRTTESLIEDDTLTADYESAEVRGQIKILWRFSNETSFELETYLMEKSSSRQEPIKVQPVLHKPFGNYFVVTLQNKEDCRHFQKQWQSAIDLSDDYLRRRMLIPQFSNEMLEQAVSYIWHSFESLPEKIRAATEANYQDYRIPEIYQCYRKVYFLNDVACRMFRQANINLDLADTVPAPEVARMGINLWLRYVYIDSQAE